MNIKINYKVLEKKPHSLSCPLLGDRVPCFPPAVTCSRSPKCLSVDDKPRATSTAQDRRAIDVPGVSSTYKSCKPQTPFTSHSLKLTILHNNMHPKVSQNKGIYVIFHLNFLQRGNICLIFMYQSQLPLPPLLPLPTSR